MSKNPNNCFIRTYWYERGIEHGNPFFNSRFRVNAPETSIHPDFMYRSEARESGMMVILIDEDLIRLDGAEIYAEIWGGHPGTANKRVTINGRSTYQLPEVGTADGHCTHIYPVIPIKITDLVNGYNALQFACDKGSTFWGHFIVDNACLRVALKHDHPDLKKAGTDKFHASVNANYSPDHSEVIILSLSCPSSGMTNILSVDYIGCYYGYDENGNGETSDWHGFTKDRCPAGIIGVSRESPFTHSWDLSMIPEQSDIAVQAVIHFKDTPDITYFTSPLRSLNTPKNRKAAVQLYTSSDLPRPFWSRANQRKKCTINLDINPGRIEHAELHIVTWDGGRGAVESPLTLNGHPVKATGEGRHDVIYSVLQIDPKILKEGANEISLLSDTEHHGIEILLPGPALMVSI